MCSVACVRAEYKPIDQSVCSSIERMMNEVKPAHLQIGKVGVDTAMVDAGKSRVKIDMNEVYGYVPSLEEYTEKVKTGISAILGGDYDVEVTVLGRPVEEWYIDADAKYVKKKEKESRTAKNMNSNSNAREWWRDTSSPRMAESVDHKKGTTKGAFSLLY